MMGLNLITAIAVIFTGTSQHSYLSTGQPSIAAGYPPPPAYATPEPLAESARPEADFLPNRGQWPADILFARFATGGAVVFRVDGHQQRLIPAAATTTPGAAATDSVAGDAGPGLSVLTTFVDAMTSGRVYGLHETGRSNTFYLGNTPERWQNDVPGYRSVVYESIYPGIDLFVTGDPLDADPFIEHIWQVQPDADPANITVRIQPVDRLVLRNDGSLDFAVQNQRLRLPPPIAWQGEGVNRIAIPVEYELREADRAYGFRFPASFDSERTLWIDPELQWAQYIGGIGSERGRAIMLTPSGGLLMVGRTSSRDFTAAVNPYAGGSYDAYIMRIQPDGAVVGSTFIGGSGLDWGRSIARTRGGLYITGRTDSTDLPMALNAAPAGDNAFIAKLDSQGRLLWTLYVGGSNNESARLILHDPVNDRLYLAGMSNSKDFVNRIGNSRYIGSFLAAISSQGEVLWSNVFGGEGKDVIRGMMLLEDGRLVLNGATTSRRFIRPINQHPGGEWAGVLTVFSPDGTINESWYYGGTGEDQGWDIYPIKGSSDVLLSGRTSSTDLPGALNDFHGGEFDGFIMRVTRHWEIVWSRYIGGLDFDDLFNITQVTDRLYAVAGNTASRDISARLNGFIGATPGAWDALVAMVSVDDGDLEWAQMFGGSASEYAYGLAYDGAGSLYVSGSTESPDFRGALNEFHGEIDAWIGQLDVSMIEDRPTMTAFGVCPGAFRVRIRNCTPNGMVRVLQARALSPHEPPNALCPGITLDLAPNTLTQVFKGRADDNGELWYDLGYVIAPDCGISALQAVDLSACATSNVMWIE